MNQYQNNFTLTSTWLSTQCRSIGAIIYTATEIQPYFANIAAIGMTRDPARLPQVVNWMRWYLSHLNSPDKWGINGTIYDYSISSTGVETSTGDCDSTDSYAATFLSLAWTAWQTGDATTQVYIKSVIAQIAAIGYAIVDKMQQPDGLTWAKPDYQFKYLQDNCEVYHGLSDLVSLFTALGNAAQATYYSSFAAASLKGVMSMLVSGQWSVYKGQTGALQPPKLANMYPDAMAQLFPVLHGVVTATSVQAIASYAAFNAAWPSWVDLSFATADDPFPLCLLGVVAGIMEDTARLEDYIASVQAKYVPEFEWPFYCAEGGSFMLANKLAPTPVIDANLELDSGWVSNVSVLIGGKVPPTAYGFAQPPAAVSDWIEFYIIGGPYTDAISSITRPIPANNTGLLTLSFDLVVDANTPNLAQALEFDAVAVDGSQYKYTAGMQFVQVLNGEIQIWINNAWVGTGISVGKFAVGVITPVSISYQFNWVSRTYQILSITVNDKTYQITMAPCPAALSDWTANTVTVQVQQDLDVSGGTMREWMRNINLEWA